MRLRSGPTKDDLARRTREKQRSYPNAEVELWAMDEHRVGRKPILRTVWAKKGERPQAVVRPRYEWLYVAAFVRPETGETSFWLIPEVNAEVSRLLIRAFAAEQGVDKRKRIRLVLDNAGWLVAESTLPDALTLDFLPPYSPELQPAERLWTLLDEPLVNQSYDSIGEVEAAVGEWCVELADMPELIRAHTLFHWWPRTGSDEYH